MGLENHYNGATPPVDLPLQVELGSYAYPLDDGAWMAVHRGERCASTFPTQAAAHAWLDDQEYNLIAGL